MALAQSNKIKFIAPPTSGMNTVDSWWDMDEKFCISMVNIEPRANYCPVRKGFERKTNTGSAYTGSTPSVVIPYNKKDGTFYALEIARSRSGRLYRYTNVGVRTELLSGGLSVNISNSLGAEFKDRVFFAGDGDTPYDYDGTTLTATAWTGPSAITSLACPFVYRGNLYFLYSSSLDVWYAKDSAITGALTRWPLDAVPTKGSFFVMGGYTQPNDGVLASDLLVLVTNVGEVLVYQGQDPASSDWSLYGRYFIPPPVSRGSFFYINGNFHILTTQGVYAMNDILAGNREGDGQYRSISKNINPELTEYLGPNKGLVYTNLFLGRASISPKENLLYLPAYRNTEVVVLGIVGIVVKFIYYVMDLETRAWGVYELPSSEGEMFSSPVASPTDLFFLSSEANDVSFWQAGTADRDYTTQYLPTSWSIKTRFINCDFPGNKKFNKFRPILSQTENYTVATQSDFNLTTANSAISYSNTSQNFVNKFSDINKEGTFLSLLISGTREADATASVRTTFFGGFISYEPGSNIP